MVSTVQVWAQDEQTRVVRYHKAPGAASGKETGICRLIRVAAGEARHAGQFLAITES